jgi:hypothetical protein
VKKREAVNLTLHITVGAALAAGVCWNHWFMVLATFVYAFLREQAQHRIEIGEFIYDAAPENRYHRIKKRTFFDFGWLGWKQVWEIGQWTLGAAVACLVWELFGS